MGSRTGHQGGEAGIAGGGLGQQQVTHGWPGMATSAWAPPRPSRGMGRSKGSGWGLGSAGAGRLGLGGGAPPGAPAVLAAAAAPQHARADPGAGGAGTCGGRRPRPARGAGCGTRAPRGPGAERRAQAGPDAPRTPGPGRGKRWPRRWRAGTGTGWGAGTCRSLCLRCARLHSAPPLPPHRLRPPSSGAG